MPSILRKFHAIFKCGTISHYVLVTNGLRSQRSHNTNLPQRFNNIIFDTSQKNPFRRLVCRLIMSAAERLSEKWTFGREAKFRGKNVRFWGQSLSQGHYQPTYQQARKGFIYFISLPLIFNSQNFKTARKHGKKASGDLMANARDWRVGVNLGMY